MNNSFHIDSVVQLANRVLDWQNGKHSGYRQLYDKFCSIYDVTEDVGRVIIPSPTLQSRVSQWLAGCPTALEDIGTQSVITIRNRVIEEETIFNALRQKRLTTASSELQKQLVEQQAEESKKTCDFCACDKCTAEDVFGRVETEHSYTAANVFKVDAWSSLVILRRHHPLDWNEDEFVDAFVNTANSWFKKVHAQDSSYRYPFVVWDLLLNGGASQVHPHFHVLMTKDRYHGGLECWRRRSCLYTRDSEQNYFNVLTEISEHLGLTVKLGTAVAMASLTPKKDNEVVLVSEQNDKQFYSLLYRIIRVFIDDLSKFGFSLAIALPTLGESSSSSSVPLFARIVTRGYVNDVRADVGALDFFTAPSISTDPFETARILQRSFERYDSSNCN